MNFIFLLFLSSLGGGAILLFRNIYYNVSQHHDDIIIKGEILNLTYCFVIFSVVKFLGQKYSKRHFAWLRSRNMKIYQPMEGNKKARPLPQGMFSTTVDVFKVSSLHYRPSTPPLDCSGDSGVACVLFCLASLWWGQGGRGGDGAKSFRQVPRAPLFTLQLC